MLLDERKESISGEDILSRNTRRGCGSVDGYLIDDAGGDWLPG